MITAPGLSLDATMSYSKSFSHAWRSDGESGTGALLGQFGPDEVIPIRPAATAREIALTESLDFCGELNKASFWNSALDPTVNAGRLDPKKASHRRRAAEELNDFGIFHAQKISSN